MAITNENEIDWRSPSVGSVELGSQEGRTVGAGNTLLLSERDLSQRWGCSVKKLQADRLKGVGVAYVKLGRLVRYQLERVLAYEEAQLHTSSSDNRHR